MLHSLSTAAANEITEPLPFVPCVALYAERLMVDRGSYCAPDYQEVEAPVLRLWFEYGSRHVAAGDPPAPALARTPALTLAGGAAGRDMAAESRARYLLESLGALELTCAEHVETPIGSRADYVVHLDEDVHTVCGFAAYAVPQLRALGWQVEVDPAYPWQTVEASAPWYASLEPDEEADWFGLELGIEVEGRRVNLLPTLLDLLDGASSLAALARRRPRCVALRVDDRRYLTLPPQRLKMLTEVLLQLYDGSKSGKVRVPADALPTLARLDQVFCGADLGRRSTLRWRRSTGRLERARAVAAAPSPVTPPPGLGATLRPYQREGVAWLQHLRRVDAGGILADDMGLGKTLQAIAHLLIEHASGLTQRPSLIVAPTSLIGNWQRELERFAPSLWVTVYHGPARADAWRSVSGCDVVLTSYPIVVRDLERIAAQEYHLLILDEAQTIKNSRSRTHRAVRGLEARHRLCLTGTPLENHLGELWSLFDFVMPDYLGDARAFGELYRQPIESGGDEQRLQALRDQVGPFILRRTKDQVATELPEKTEVVRAVELHGAQRELYESIRVAAHAKVREAIAARGMARATVTILDALMKLRQVCCDPRLVRMSAARQAQESAKYELLFELLPRQLEQGRKILLFSQFTSMLKLIGEGLRERRIRFLTLTGATTDRQQRIDAFCAGMADVFLISLKAGGTGLNLTQADTVIHYDPWWNPAAQAQATDRAHRMGQRRPVFVYNLIVAGSVEERMLQLQRRKRQLAETILGTGSSFDLTEHEVDDLFGPLARPR